MEVVSETDRGERVYGNCMVSWVVGSYGLAAYGKKHILSSPPFTVRPHMTIWRLVLENECALSDDQDIMVYLERAESDAEQDAMRVNWEVSILNKDSNLCGSARMERYIERSVRFGLRVPNIFHRNFRMGVYEYDVMTIQCHMLVQSPNYLMKDPYINPPDYELATLSLDLKWLYRGRKFSDVVLKFGDDTFPLHKAILCSRNMIFYEKYRVKGKSHIIDVSSLCSMGMQKVLPYLYTADIEQFLAQPSLPSNNCAMNLYVDDLESHYFSDTQKMNTKIEVEILTHRWIIKDFSKLKECTSSTMITFVYWVDGTWQLHLYPRGIGGNGESVSIVLETLEGEDLDMWAQVAIFEEGKHRDWQNMVKSATNEHIFELANFIPRESLPEKLKDDVLTISFKLLLVTEEKSSSQPQMVVRLPYCTFEDCLKKLSADISSLRKDDRHTDITLKVEGKEFKVHKCILAARSVMFCRIFSDLDDHKYLPVKNIKAEIFEILLDYIYSGVFKEYEYNILIELYRASGEYTVPQLAHACSNALRKYLKLETAFELFVSAHIAGDGNVKAEALNLLVLNMNNTYVQENVKKLEFENPYLYDKVKKAVEAGTENNQSLINGISRLQL